MVLKSEVVTDSLKKTERAKNASAGLELERDPFSFALHWPQSHVSCASEVCVTRYKQLPPR